MKRRGVRGNIESPKGQVHRIMPVEGTPVANPNRSEGVTTSCTPVEQMLLNDIRPRIVARTVEGASREGRSTWGGRIRVARKVLLVLLLYLSSALFVYLRLMPRWAERFEEDRQSASDPWLRARDDVVRFFVLPVEWARLHSSAFYKLTYFYLRKTCARSWVYARKPPVCRWRSDQYSSSGVRTCESIYSSKGYPVGFYRMWDETGVLGVEMPYNEFGQLHGDWKWWDYEGRLFKQQAYCNGVLNGPYFMKAHEGIVRGTWRNGRMQDGTFTVEYQPMAPNGALDYSEFGTALVSNNVLLSLFHDTELKSPVESGVMTGWFFWDEASSNAARRMVTAHSVGVVFSNGVPASLRDVSESDGVDIRVPPGDLSQCDFRMAIDPMIDYVVRFGFRKDSGTSENAPLMSAEMGRHP